MFRLPKSNPTQPNPIQTYCIRPKEAQRIVARYSRTLSLWRQWSTPTHHIFALPDVLFTGNAWQGPMGAKASPSLSTNMTCSWCRYCLLETGRDFQRIRLQAMWQGGSVGSVNTRLWAFLLEGSRKSLCLVCICEVCVCVCVCACICVCGQRFYFHLCFFFSFVQSCQITGILWRFRPVWPSIRTLRRANSKSLFLFYLSCLSLTLSLLISYFPDSIFFFHLLCLTSIPSLLPITFSLYTAS